MPEGRLPNMFPGCDHFASGLWSVHAAPVAPIVWRVYLLPSVSVEVLDNTEGWHVCPNWLFESLVFIVWQVWLTSGWSWSVLARRLGQRTGTWASGQSWWNLSCMAFSAVAICRQGLSTSASFTCNRDDNSSSLSCWGDHMLSIYKLLEQCLGSKHWVSIAISTGLKNQWQHSGLMMWHLFIKCTCYLVVEASTSFSELKKRKITVPVTVRAI